MLDCNGCKKLISVTEAPGEHEALKCEPLDRILSRCGQHCGVMTPDDCPEICYSSGDDEEFEKNLDTVIDEMIDNDQDLLYKETLSITVGLPVSRKASDLLPAEDYLLEGMQECAHDEAGEWAQEWLRDVSADQMSDLQARLVVMIDAWADEYNMHPSFFSVPQHEQREVVNPRYQEPCEGNLYADGQCIASGEDCQQGGCLLGQWKG